MTRKTRSLVATSLLLSGCATTPSEARPYQLLIDGDEVQLSMNGDISVGSFLELAQEVTHQIYVFDRAQADAAGPVSLLGDIQCERGAFDDFVDVVLYTHGLDTERRVSKGAPYVRVRAIAGGSDS